MVIVFDIDNTLYDFVAYHSYVFRSVVHIVARETRVDENDVRDDLKSIFQRHGSLEYGFLIQESDLISSFNEEKKKRLSFLLSVGARQVRNTRLNLYHGVRESLEAILRGKYTCVALTNAPFSQIDQRFKHLGLHKYFDALLCATAFTPPSTEERLKYERRREQVARKYRRFVELDKVSQKPSVRPFEVIKDLYPNQTYVAIGDSLQRDLLPASKCGYRTIWARYGTIVAEKDLDTILGITPWSEGKVKEDGLSSFKPDFTIDSFDEIIDVLNIPVISEPEQPDLFS